MTGPLGHLGRYPLEPMPETRAKSRFLTFSIRTVLVLTAVFSICLAYYVPRAMKHQKAAQWVRELGSEPMYSYQLDSNGDTDPNAKLPVPKFAVESLGIDYFSSVEMIHLDSKNAKDLLNLAGLSSLKHLEVADAGVTDLSPLYDISATLEHLSISRNPISDITPIENLKNLKRFYAYETEIKNLDALKNLKSLESVILNDTKIDDLTPLEHHPRIEYLDISNTPVSDLTPLKSIKTLTDLILRRTPVSDTEISELQQALPNCRISR